MCDCTLKPYSLSYIKYLTFLECAQMCSLKYTIIFSYRVLWIQNDRWLNELVKPGRGGGGKLVFIIIIIIINLRAMEMISLELIPSQW